MAYLEIHPESPQDRLVQQAVDVLKKGGTIIYPTDSVYAIGCAVDQQKAVDQICRIKKMDPTKAMFSLVCSDISQIAQYTKQIDNNSFKLLKNHLPGAFTFIMEAGSQIPKQFKNRKKTLGLRIPDHKVANAIVEALGVPLMSTSLPYDLETDLPLTDIDEVRDLYEKQVDLVVHGGPIGGEPSTVVDLTGDEPEIFREGAGVLDW